MADDDSAPLDPRGALGQLGSLMLRGQATDTWLQGVVDLTKAVMPGNAEASLTLLLDDRPTTAVSTGPLALDCDESQYGSGSGPCLHAATTGELTEVPDTRTDGRWRDYMTSAADRGALSSLSVPLPTAEGIRGALNVYAREPHAFDDAARSAAAGFVPYAAVAVATTHAYDDVRAMADNLQRALESRAVIDQAKGILMERHKVTADQAFELLAQVSMHRNEKVRVVAETLVRTGDLPRFPGRR